MAPHALLSPESRSRAAILPLLRILEDHGAEARKSRPAATASKAGRKKKVLVLTAVVSVVLMFALLKTRTLDGRVLLRHRPATVISVPRPPYAAHRRVQGDSVTASLVAAQAGSVALLNFSPAEVRRGRKLQPLHTTVRAVRLQPVDSAVTWAALYPEWIDEDGNGTNSGSCPSLPDPEDQGGQRFDLVAVNLPCRSRNDSGRWSRDVARLHLQLSAAKLAVSVQSSHVLVVSDCLPLPNLFPCKHLFHQHGHARLYRAHAAYLRPPTRLPVGSCDLALRLPTIPLKPLTVLRRRREAYATVLHSSDAYVCGAIAVAQSIRQSGSTRDLVALVFTWWHRLPRTVNVLKYYHQQGHAAAAASAPPSPEPYLLHYLGIKPWLCFRDYDCNWNVPSLRQFANDEAHARWWAVHDRIKPGELAARFCALPKSQRSSLQYERRQAEKANATDMHWSRPITDPRNTQQLLLPMPPTA
uniref:Hexosyltransferase n=1 Tax=Aegilops tauschii TaxID=37682 RepID=R7W929_AEGTA